MAGRRAGIKIPVQDPESGRVYEILWTQPDKEPTKWDLLAALDEQKRAEEWKAKPGVFSSHPALKDFEIGNRLYQKGVEAESVPAFNFEQRGTGIRAEPQHGAVYKALSKINPFFEPAMGEIRKLQDVSNLQSFADRTTKAPLAKTAGIMGGDIFSPASVFFNSVGVAGAGQAMKGALNEAKAIRNFAAKPAADIGKIRNILATANPNSPEFKAAAVELGNFVGLDLNLPPGDIKVQRIKPKKTPVKLSADESAVVSDFNKQAFALKKAGDLEGAKATIAQARAYVKGLSKKPQMELNLSGNSSASQVAKKPKTKIKPFTYVLADPTWDNVAPFMHQFVDQRNSADMVRERVGRLFGSLKNEGFDAVKRYQSGDRSGMFGDVEKMLRKEWIDRQMLGDTSKFKSNYLSQYWGNTPEELQEIYKLAKPPKQVGPTATRKAGISPGFTKKSTFATYEEGMEASAGRLKPKYDNMADILAQNMVDSNRYQANKALMNFLQANKLIALDGSKKAAKGGFEIVAHLPGVRREGQQGIVRWAARPDVAKYLNNYFGEAWKPAQKWGNWANVSKAISMGAGIPFTALNAHGFNIAKAAFDMGGLRGLTDFFTTGITTPGARKGYEKIFSDPTNLKDLLDLSKRGYVGNIAEDFRNLGGKTGLAFGDTLRASKNPIMRGLGKTEGVLSDVIEKPLFGYKLPATKARESLIRLKYLQSQGIPREQALRQVADEANTMFGGMNYVRNFDPTTSNPFKSGGLSRTAEQILKGVVLAPDWAGRNIKLGKNVYKSLFGAADPMYARIAARNAALRNVSRVAAQRQFGDDLDEQKSSEASMIPIGETADGLKRRNFDPFGTSTEWMRIPNQILTDLGHGQISPANKLFTNRLNPLTRAFVSMMSNQDYNENKLWGEDRWNRPIPWPVATANMAKVLTSPFMHPVAGQIINLVTGQSGWEDAAVQSFEGPFKYRYIRQGGGRKSTNPFANPYGGNSNPYDIQF